MQAKNARCAQARKIMHARPGWTHQDVDRTPRQSEWQRTEKNGESTSTVWPTLGSRTAKEQNRTSYWFICEALVEWMSVLHPAHRRPWFAGSLARELQVTACLQHDMVNCRLSLHPTQPTYIDRESTVWPKRLQFLNESRGVHRRGRGMTHVASLKFQEGEDKIAWNSV